MTKRQLILFSALAIVLGTSAYDFSANGLYYNKLSPTTIEVAKGAAKYAGAVSIPSTVTYEGVGYTVTSIGNSAFNNCNALTSVTIPNTVTSIGEGAFFLCSGLSSASIPGSVTSIGNTAFFGCSGLTTVSIPESVKSIENFAFCGCSALTSVTIPNSVISIGTGAFSNCRQLHAFEGKFASDDNRCLIVEGNMVSFAPGGLTEYTLPEDVKSIGWYAFECCSELRSINIPNSTTTVGWHAFSNCSGLESLTFPDSMTSIGTAAFSGCTDLASITLPASVTSIGEWLFSGCSGLSSLVCLVRDPAQISVDSSTFNNMSQASCTLYVPFGSKALYEAADQWRDFARIEEMAYYTPGDVNGDGSYSAVDVSMVVSFVLGGSPEGAIREAADVNGDGNISAADVSIVVSYVLSGLPAGATVNR